MEETCENCKHWEPLYNSETRGKCCRIRTAIGRYTAELFPGPQVGDYLMTWDGFGCNLFEDKIVVRHEDKTVTAWKKEDGAAEVCMFITERWPSRKG